MMYERNTRCWCIEPSDIPVNAVMHLLDFASIWGYFPTIRFCTFVSSLRAILYRQGIFGLLL